MIWVELVCDRCSYTFEGKSIHQFKQREYLAEAARRGWKTFGKEHLCDICLHAQASGHRVCTVGRYCLAEGCRLNPFGIK